jgi:tetratricopeptide (TPR) repeat protein
MKKTAILIGLLLLVTFVTGCATPGTSRQSVAKSETMSAEEYLAKAQSLEQQGEPVEALKMYKLALTVDPKNSQTQQKITALETELNQLAEQRYQAGMNYRKMGNYARAKQEFLTALRYNPEHMQAREMLTGKVSQVDQVKQYVVHVLQPNESLSSLADKYYGDYRKFHLIAEFNEIQDATRVRVGQEIKVPVLQGVPIIAEPDQIVTEGGKPGRLPESVITVKGYALHTIEPGDSLSKLAKEYYGDYKHYDLIAKFNGIADVTGIRVGQEIKIPEVSGLPFLIEEKQRIEVEEQTVTAAPAPPQPKPVRPPPTQPKKAEPAPAPVPEPAEPSIEEQIAAYREQGIEFYNSREYDSAISEFQKVLGASPNDAVAVEYLSRSYYEQGIEAFKNKNYPSAIAHFENALKYDPGCETCRAYIAKSEQTYKEQHYNNGLEYFKAENLTEAIREWEMVYAMDPGYKDVERNLTKARRLQERLETIKKSTE